jgi:hypothetical protein
MLLDECNCEVLLRGRTPEDNTCPECGNIRDECSCGRCEHCNELYDNCECERCPASDEVMTRGYCDECDHRDSDGNCNY